ncbi:MAG: UvrB/UvrC motif-containing protein [Oscillospiraceae bacterium]|nr:UvrB/UvrC motif-containing protein [Oscillospiraceae bacterium]
MKCEKCNNNEVSFIYESNINGKKSSKHLCSECAKAEGLDRAFMSNRRDIFDEFFGENDSLFSPLFAFPRRSLLGSFGGQSLAKSLLTPAFPRFLFIDDTEEKCGSNESSCDCGKTCECGEDNCHSDNSDEEISGKRKLEALRYELDKAVKAENFEKAIELRDEIKRLKEGN